jgi:hypothetical protein
MAFVPSVLRIQLAREHCAVLVAAIGKISDHVAGLEQAGIDYRLSDISRYLFGQGFRNRTFA